MDGHFNTQEIAKTSDSDNSYYLYFHVCSTTRSYQYHLYYQELQITNSCYYIVADVTAYLALGSPVLCMDLVFAEGTLLVLVWLEFEGFKLMRVGELLL